MVWGCRWRWWGLLRCALVALDIALAFLVVTGPWLSRNYSVSHNLLGLASYSVMERMPAMPGEKLQRMLEPKTLSVTCDRDAPEGSC